MYAKFIAVGRLTADPQLKTITINGDAVPVCNFSIAVDPDSANGQTDFYDCVVWRKQAENLATYMGKGNAILVEGRPHTRSWEHEGVTKYKTEYRISNIRFVERGKSKQETEVVEDDPF